MIDLADIDVSQLRHPPRATVEASTDDDELRVRAGTLGVVGGDRPKRHRLRLPPEQLEVESGCPPLRWSVGPGALDRSALVIAKQPESSGVIEATHGKPAVCHGAAWHTSTAVRLAFAAFMFGSVSRTMCPPREPQSCRVASFAALAPSARNGPVSFRPSAPNAATSSGAARELMIAVVARAAAEGSRPSGEATTGTYLKGEPDEHWCHGSLPGYRPLRHSSNLRSPRTS